MTPTTDLIRADKDIKTDVVEELRWDTRLVNSQNSKQATPRAPDAAERRRPKPEASWARRDLCKPV
jgi:hypothetical protein